jgi:peptidylprolyl isomerase
MTRLRRISLLASLAITAAVIAAIAQANQPATVPAGEKRTTESGLTIIDTAKGTGAKVGDTVLVHYTGTLDDGTKFDSSRDRGEPIQLRLGEGRVIKGWEEGLVGMNVGDKRVLIIPANLAYGDKQRGPIPPNSTLTFDLELVGIIRQ